MLLLTIVVYSDVKWCWGRVDNPSGQISYWGASKCGKCSLPWSLKRWICSEKSAFWIHANNSIWSMQGGILPLKVCIPSRSAETAVLRVMLSTVPVPTFVPWVHRSVLANILRETVAAISPKMGCVSPHVRWAERSAQPTSHHCTAHALGLVRRSSVRHC